MKIWKIKFQTKKKGNKIKINIVRILVIIIILHSFTQTNVFMIESTLDFIPKEKLT